MKNLGSADRIIRVVVAVLISILYFAHVISGTSAMVLLVLAGVFILTSSISLCPLYLPFNFSTRKKES
jgi:hypothetical protein